MDGMVTTDLPGRLRLRFKAQTIRPLDYEILCRDIKLLSGIYDCCYNLLTGSFLILYHPEGQTKTLIFTSVIDFQPSNKAAISSPGESSPENILPSNPIWSHLGTNLLLPFPIRAAVNILKSIPRLLKGIFSLIKGSLDVDVLDAVALTVCFLRRDFRGVGILLFFFSLGHFLEMWTKNRSRSGLYRSLAGQVEKVWIKTPDGLEMLVDESEITINSLVIVRAGSLIPVDGTVEEGEALVNQASMTGEALAVHRTQGTSVFAGTTVEEGEIVVRATKVGGETRVRSIVRYIEDSEASKAGLQGRAERLADSIVPFSFLLSALVFLITRDPLKAGNVLLVDYSCAIRLSTPLAVLTAMREGNNKGILIKGGRYLEEMAGANTAVFDKTGTLTQAKPVVEEILPFGNFNQDEALRLAACLEEHFPHPVGRAIVRAAREKNLHHEEEHAKVNYVVAHGICSTWREMEVVLGSHHFVVDDIGISLNAVEIASVEDQTKKGCSVLYLAVGGSLAAIISIRDKLRPEARTVMDKLATAGLSQTIMLTGDVEGAAATVAREVGISEYRAQMLPNHKAEFIENLVKSGRHVLMMGDGLNDSAALSRANVGVSLGDSSALAKDVANILLLNDDLHDLVLARNLSTKTMRRIKSNYWFIVALNTAFIGLGIFGTLGPGLMALLHNATTAAVAWRATRPYLVERKTIESNETAHE